MATLNQRGSHLLAVTLGIVVIAIIGFAGYRIATKSDDNKSAEASTQTSLPSQINSKSDLESASKSLDSTNATINGDLNTDSLNNDLDDLL